MTLLLASHPRFWEHETGAGMNSHNHAMYASVGSWLHRWVAGLQLAPDAVAASRLVISPDLDSPVPAACAEHRTVRGRGAVSWHRDGEHVELEAVVPAGATALVAATGAELGPGIHRLTLR